MAPDVGELVDEYEAATGGHMAATAAMEIQAKRLEAAKAALLNAMRLNREVVVRGGKAYVPTGIGGSSWLEVSRFDVLPARVADLTVRPVNEIERPAPTPKRGR